MTHENEQLRVYRPRQKQPKIVAIGGGHGLSAMLRGLKAYSRNLTAIVTVADDGGGSGMLRQDLNMPPPGDIRNCLEALANTEPLMAELLHYRFTDGSLSGQSFGNLFLAALNGIDGSADIAEFKAGDLTVKKSGTDAASRCLQHQAQLMIAPYLQDNFSFLGV